MSLALITEAWQHFPEGGAKLNTLQALAEASGEQGGCYVTARQIAQLARQSRAATARALAELRRERWVVASRILGRGGKLVYQINLPKLRRSHRRIDPTDAVAIVEQRQQPASATHEDLQQRVALRTAGSQDETVTASALNRAGKGKDGSRRAERGATAALPEPESGLDSSLHSLPVSQGKGVSGSEEEESNGSLIRASKGENQKSVTTSAQLSESLQPAASDVASETGEGTQESWTLHALSVRPVALDSSSLSRQQDEEGRALPVAAVEVLARESIAREFGSLEDFTRDTGLEPTPGASGAVLAAGDGLTRIREYKFEDEKQGAEGCADVDEEHLEPPSASSGADWAGFEPASEGKRPSSRPARRFW